ncbi:MAG: peptidoglycan-associated lipoprotein Pal [Chromatiaceae bacterium]|jgi:peptidoglycan-associated lipoprotein|nr:peptidoglycan-associated lipoprotein Pal [Chromatiaceae bacterium]
MKSKSSVWLAIAMLASLFAGCSSTGSKDDPGASIEDRGAAGAYTSGASQGGTWSGNPLDNPNSPLYTKTIYFDFDQSTIRSDFIDVLRAHAAYINSNRSATVLIEGHADERGSREYNIGLGERRANAIRNFLEAEGVADTQINTISYGEERPAALGHDEVSLSENRRGVLVY